MSDVDTGRKVVVKSLNMREKEAEDIRINYFLFQRIFMRCIFKESLVEVLREIEEGVQRVKRKDPTLNKNKSFRKHSVHALFNEKTASRTAMETV